MTEAAFPLDPARAEALEEALKRALETDGAPAELSKSARYVMGWQDEVGRASDARGKRTRPTLCIVACEALGGTLEDALPGAVAVELIHNFSLVHDEIQDADEERHGRPTSWRIVGQGQAINVGDLLFTAALRALTRSTQPPSRRIDALNVLLEAVAEMVAGQWEDLSFEGGETVTEHDYLRMVSRKTGALLGAPVEIGAILAGASKATAAELGLWGRQAGVAFQIQDDFLGIWGVPDETGKSNTNDIARRKASYPIIAALSDPDARAVIGAEYGKPSGETPDVTRVAAALERCGAAARTRETARRLAAESGAGLEAIGLPDGARRALTGIESALVDRRF